MSSAARAARRGSLSCARGAPNSAITASPICLSTVPPYPTTIPSTWVVKLATSSRICSGSSDRDKLVNPQRSANRIVTWRRSQLAWSTRLEGFLVDADRSSSIASNSLLRCPNELTPSSLRSASVKAGITSKSMLFSTNAGTYWANPRFRSHCSTPMRNRNLAPLGSSRVLPINDNSKDARGFGVLAHARRRTR
jgi:hypothetical protein